MMVKWAGGKASKEQMNVYVHPRVKRGMRIAAAQGLTTISKIVEDLCIEYLRKQPGIGELIEKGE